MPRGRPRKNPLTVEVNNNVVGENQNPVETVTVNKKIYPGRCKSNLYGLWCGNSRYA